MVVNKSFSMLLGVVALSAAGTALAANTSSGSNGTIFLTIDDVNQTTSYVLDTGITLNNFNGSVSQHWNLTGTNYSNFLSSILTGDTVNWTVLGGSTYPSSVGSIPAGSERVFTTATTTPTVNDARVDSALLQIQTELNNVNNPAGGNSFQASPGQGWVASGTQAQFNSSGGFSITSSKNGSPATVAGALPTSIVGSSIAFYDALSHQAGDPDSTATKFAGTFSIVNAGAGGWQLQYNVGSVPLPAPLLLLLSGFGLTGLVARRRRPGAADAVAA